MPPKSDPRREEAFRLYIDSGGELPLKSIAEKLGLPMSTVTSWKKRGNWEEKLHQNEAAIKTRTPTGKKRKRAGYFGNKNAVGAGASHIGNTRAVTHGLYESIKYDTMTPQELQLMQDAEVTDPVAIQQQLIREMEVREHRMFHRIDELRKKAQADAEGYISESISVEQTTKGNHTSTKAQKKKVSPLQQIQDIETALSVLQRQKQAAILALHKLQQDAKAIDMDERRLEIQQARLEIERRKLAIIDPAQESDALKEARRLLEGIESAF